MSTILYKSKCTDSTLVIDDKSTHKSLDIRNDYTILAHKLKADNVKVDNVKVDNKRVGNIKVDNSLVLMLKTIFFLS